MKFNVGDKVVCVKGSRDLYEGVQYEISEVHPDTYGLVKVEENECYWAYSRFILAPVPATRNTAPKPGDTVTNELGGKQAFLLARFDCIPPECLRLLAECVGFGMNKYGRDNWRKIPLEDNIAHAMNHLNEYRMNDHSEPHLVNAFARVAFALSQAVEIGEQEKHYVHPDMVSE